MSATFTGSDSTCGTREWLHRADSRASDCKSRDPRFEYLLSHITFMEIDHLIISMVILPLPLIQEGQLSVTSENLCTSTG